MLCAGIDGIKNQIDPGSPLDVDIYELSPEELAKVPSTPGSLAEALKNLETDHDYLTSGGVFTEDFIESWISYKLDREVIPMQIRPHPYEFMLYYDC
jgi:glutamine synthetase